MALRITVGREGEVREERYETKWHATAEEERAEEIRRAAAEREEREEHLKTCRKCRALMGLGEPEEAVVEAGAGAGEKLYTGVYL